MLDINFIKDNKDLVVKSIKFGPNEESDNEEDKYKSTIIFKIK